MTQKYTFFSYGSGYGLVYGDGLGCSLVWFMQV